MVRSKSGFIYVIEDEPNICKIGCSTNFPNRRLADISGKYHKDFKLKGYAESDDCLQDEKTIHKYLNDHRLKGEWFNLSWEDIKDKCEKIRFYFRDPEWFIKRDRFINSIYWDEKKQKWVPYEEAGFDEDGNRFGS